MKGSENSQDGAGAGAPLRQARAILVLLALTSLAAMIAGVAVLAGSSASHPETALPDVILITVDTLRADRLGCYGNPAHQTPTMDGIARDGIVFQRAIAQVPLTLPSHTAILTGTYPMWNGVEDLETSGLPGGIPTLAEIFKSHGYATAAFVSSFVLDSMWGLNRGFDTYDDWFKVENEKAVRHQSLERKAEETIDHCLNWFQTHKSGPFFVWLHLYDPHAPYDPPEPFKSSYRGRLYDGEVAYADHQLGRLVIYLKNSRLYSPSLIVLTSDHGEGLGEHQEIQHGFFIYNSTVHVPLLVKLPTGSRLVEHVVPDVVSGVDIAPTLTQFCRFPSSETASFQGRSLLSLIEGSPGGTARGGYSESLYPRTAFGWHSLHGVETGRYHYIDTSRAELYDLDRDPRETRNIVEQRPAVAAALKETLQATIARYNRQGEKPRENILLDPDAAEKLRSLGYVSLAQPGPVATDAPEAADPKDEIGFYNQILRATELAEDGRLRESTALLVKAEAEHPQIGLVPYLEGENLLALGQPREAMQCYRRALKLNPGAEQTAMGLGHAAYLAGDATEATKAYQWALALNPNNFIVRLALARVDWQLNQFQEAADEQRKVLRAHPRFGQAQADYGVTLAHLKKYDAALTSLKQGLELGYHTANTYNFLGNTYLALGHDKEALEAYERASREDPKDATAYINLAAIYAKLGDRDRSQQNLQKGCGLNPGLCRRMASRPH